MSSAGSPFNRYVALGDSFTEGVGDADPRRPNGVRGWADRVAEVLAVLSPDFGYANLAIRGRKLQSILDEQLDVALGLAPDLVTVYAGANDIMRPKVDIDAIAAAYDEAIAKLTATGAKVLMWTAYDVGRSAIYGGVRGRFAIYNEHVREIADRHGATIVDFWRLDEYDDPRMWDTDRMHMSSAGHRRMAMEVLDVLGIDHDLVADTWGALPTATRREALVANAQWFRGFALPWVHRRVTGRSSGDALSPRYPGLAPVERSDG